MISFSKFLSVLFTFLTQEFIVFLSQFNIGWILVTKYGADVVRNELETDIDWESNEGNDQTVDPLGCCQSIFMDGHKSSKKLRADNLEDDNNGPNYNECWIGENTFKNIHLVVNLSCTDHVEDLHEDKHVEDDSQMSGWRNFFERSVNWSLFCVLKNTKKNVEIAIGPFLLK